jgi:hypothetical protein
MLQQGPLIRIPPNILYQQPQQQPQQQPHQKPQQQPQQKAQITIIPKSSNQSSWKIV